MATALKKLLNNAKTAVKKVTNKVATVAKKVVPTIAEKSASIVQTVASVATGNVVGVVQGVANIVTPSSIKNTSSEPIVKEVTISSSVNNVSSAVKRYDDFTKKLRG